MELKPENNVNKVKKYHKDKDMVFDSSSKNIKIFFWILKLYYNGQADP